MLGYFVGAEDYFTHMRNVTISYKKSVKVLSGLDFRHNMEVVRNQNGSYSAHVFADRAIQIVRQHSLYNRDQVSVLSKIIQYFWGFSLIYLFTDCYSDNNGARVN